MLLFMRIYDTVFHRRLWFIIYFIITQFYGYEQAAGFTFYRI